MDFEKYLSERINKNSKEWGKLVSEVSAACGYSSKGISQFVYDLMIDCNFHSEAKDVARMISDI